MLLKKERMVNQLGGLPAPRVEPYEHPRASYTPAQLARRHGRLPIALQPADEHCRIAPIAFRW